nr:hypothetical protein [Legionella jordanis]
MKNRLNGWQRLWVTIGIVYLLGIISFAWIIFPTEIPQIDRCKDPRYPLYNNPFCDLVPIPPKKDAKDLLAYEEILKIEQKKVLREEQFQLFKFAILLWIIPMLFLYALGLLIAWVYKGFKSNN